MLIKLAKLQVSINMISTKFTGEYHLYFDILIHRIFSKYCLIVFF